MDETPADLGTEGGSAPMAPTGDRGETVTLIDVLGRLEADGFTGQLGEHEGRIRCFTCRADSDPGAFDVAAVRRLEGASDPADMLAVLALTCPSCGALGTLTLNYGPECTPGEATVLQSVEVRAENRP